MKSPDEVAEQLAHDHEICLDCSNTRQWHREHRPKHMFRSDPDQPALTPTGRSSALGKNDTLSPGRIQAMPPSAQIHIPMDPVLRLALIDAGILTLEQLEAAEKKAASLGLAVAKPLATIRPSLEDQDDDHTDSSVHGSSDQGDAAHRKGKAAQRSRRSDPA